MVFIYKEGIRINLKRWLRKSVEIEEPKKLIENLNHLNPSEKEKIINDNAHKYLEEGDFYDGYLWRNVYGKPYPHHPNQERILNDYIQTLNEE